jgi:feruloyl esterase
MFYQALTAALHGRQKAEASVRLFLVPGMQHRSGGIGPDHLETLSAIEHGKTPEVIAARTKPDAAAQHLLPLCPCTQQARYSGSGALDDDAANWKCASPGHETARNGHAGSAG